MKTFARIALTGLMLASLVAAIHFVGGDAASGLVAAATVYSVQLTDVSGVPARDYPIKDHGKLRIQYFYYINDTGGTLADGTEIDLFDLPPGRLAILPDLSRYRMTAQGASRTLDIGHRAYYKDNSTTDVDEDDDAFVANKDVSSAVTNVAWDLGATAMFIHIYSKGGVRVFATVDGGTIPASAILEGFCIYVYD